MNPAQIKVLAEKEGLFLLGLTGGIASGKTTVSHMLSELGLQTIDFDILARQVVTPGKPAWIDIVNFFGKSILMEDSTLDRKRMSSIVFNDITKRKKLESFTHPRIYEEFINQINFIAKKSPFSIVQVVIPLLLEQKLQEMFHKILVVYIPCELQIERLSKRDNISYQEASTILNSQIPIIDKLKIADYVINNKDSIESTKEQTVNLWKELTALAK